jgi:hypothetical protein
VSGWPWTYVCVGQELMSVLAKNKLCICVGNVCWLLVGLGHEPSFCQKFLSNIAPEIPDCCNCNKCSSPQIVHDTQHQ